jgi:hypothetical protein
MTPRIVLAAVADALEPVAFSPGSSAPTLEASAVTLRFRLTAADDTSLEAVRYARRAMLREERTLGIEDSDPSLEGAVFSATEIQWRVSPLQRERCLEKLTDLVGRANRALEQLLLVPAFRKEAETGREP